MKILFLSVISSIVLASACGTSKDAATTEQTSATNAAAAEGAESTTTSAASNPSSATSATSTTTQNQSMNQQKPEEVKYRLIISFISIGEGTDPDARAIMDKVILGWETKIGKQLVMENYPWGREGEVDFCFHLKELSPQDQAAFTREMREAMKSRQLIQISEFQASTHKR